MSLPTEEAGVSSSSGRNAMNEHSPLIKETAASTQTSLGSSSASFFSSVFPFLTHSDYDKTSVFLYVFIAVILLLHAFAFVAWLVFFLRDLANNKAASVIQSKADRKTARKPAKTISSEKEKDLSRSTGEQLSGKSFSSQNKARKEEETSLRRRPPKPSVF